MPLNDRPAWFLKIRTAAKTVIYAKEKVVDPVVATITALGIAWGLLMVVMISMIPFFAVVNWVSGDHSGRLLRFFDFSRIDGSSLLIGTGLGYWGGRAIHRLGLSGHVE
jgi:hypothetical protein